MNAEQSRRISGPDGFSGLMTQIKREATSHQHSTSEIHVVSDDGDQFLIRFEDGTDTSAFVAKVISAFRFNPDWRENFRVFTHAHATMPLRYMDGYTGTVDTSIGVYVQELNNRGFRTLESCEGDNHPMGRMPSITFADQIPEPLHKVWSALGWINMDLSVTPIPCRGHTKVFQQMFIVILDDWMFGQLDTTAKRYRADRVAKPMIPELPPVNASALRDHQALVSKRVKKINTLGESATFDDLVKLRSGRDSYSTWKIPELKKALANDPALNYLESHIHTTPALQRAMRWRMRGLDLAMIMKKHEVDQVLESRALRIKQEKLQTKG